MRVFISHSSADKPAVLPLAAALRAKGIDVWLDQWEIAPTDDIVQSINSGLEQADAGIIVFSEHSEKSQWVKAEVSYLTYARIQEAKPLIPVTLSASAYVPPLLRPLLRCRIDQIDIISDALLHRLTGPPPLRPPEQGLIDPILITLRRNSSTHVITSEFHFRQQFLFTASLPDLPTALIHARNDFLRGLSAGVRSPAEAQRASLESNLAILGDELRALCLPGDAASALAIILDGAPLGTTIEMCVETSDPTLLALPFEALRLPDARPVALHPHVVLYRRVTGLNAPSTPLLAGPIKILVAIGAPDEDKAPGLPVLDLERELQNILDAVQPAQLLENIEVRILEVGHPAVIGDAIQRDAYHILHLSCHGLPGMLELEDEEGRAVRTTAKELLDPIRQAGRPLPMVLLSSCHGGVHDSRATSFAEELLQSGVPAVLAMQTSVSDFYATRLSRLFYENLANRELLLPSRALAAARQIIEQERAKAIQENAPLSETQPEFATAGLFLAGAERPLANFGRDKQPLQRRPVYEVAGPVPQLRIDDLIGRRRELRTALRTLRDPNRQYAGVVLTGLGGVGKSALAGRIMQRLAEDGWFLAAHPGKLDFTAIARAIATPLRQSRHKDLAALLTQEGLKDTDLLQLLAQSLAELPLLLVLDDFEQNLTPGGGAFSNPELANYLGYLAQNCRRGRLLLTCRYPVPGFEAFLDRVPVLPLSAAETRKLFLRLPALKFLEPGQSLALMRTIGGHPRMFEFLDALMRGGKGRLPHLTQKLRTLCQDLGINPAVESRTLSQSLDEALKLGARDVFLSELLTLARGNHWDEPLLQLAVSNLPVSPAGLARMLNETPANCATGLAALENLSLVYRFPDQSALVHRWTAEGLARLEGEEPTRHRAHRAGTYRWDLVDETDAIEDAVESVRNFLVAKDFDAMDAPATACLEFFASSSQTIRLAALASEILETFPETHANFAWFAGQEANAHLSLGLTQLAVSRWTQVNRVLEHRAQAEPNRAHLQRELSVSYNKLGDISRALGQNESAQTYFLKDLAIAERLAEAESHNADLQRDLSVSYGKLGDVAGDLGQIESAQAYWLNNLAIFERLAQSEPNRADLQRDLSVSYNKLGDLARALGQNESAQDYFRKSLTIRERLAQAEPNRADLQRDLSVSYNKLGELASDLGQNESAQAYFQKTLAIAERLAQAEPSRADLQRDLFFSYYKLGDFPRALAILEDLKNDGRLLPIDEPWLTKLRELIQKAEGSSA